jgi:TonB family protein
MRTRSAALFLALGLAAFVHQNDRAAAQVAAPVYQSEAQLLTQITQQPRVISNYLDLARLYFEQRRYDDAQKMLARAMTLIDQQRQAMSPPQVKVPVIPTPGTTPARPPATAGSSAPVRVGGDIREPKKIRHVPPVYPSIAQTAAVQGLVIIEAVIDQQGNVKSTKVLRSVPLLDQAAVDAVQQWQFTPTLLNGVPVEVIMTVTVNFSLSGAAASPGPGQPLRIGGPVVEPKKLVHVAPIYPADAQAARVSGLVIVEIVIDQQGNVFDAKVIRSVPLLDAAALDAVRQWKFSPTLVGGAAVPVVMTVTVSFSLSK